MDYCQRLHEEQQHVRPPLQAITKGPNKGVLQERLDTGKLPAHVPGPLFVVADPNHRRKKQLVGELIGIDTTRNVGQRLTMTRMDSTRIGKNFGYMARTLRRLEEAQYDDAADAVLQHHFDNHKHCGAWCHIERTCRKKRKMLVLPTTDARQNRHLSIHYYKRLSVATLVMIGWLKSCMAWTPISMNLSTILPLGSHQRTKSIVGQSH
jgi:hypothetical protein